MKIQDRRKELNPSLDRGSPRGADFYGYSLPKKTQNDILSKGEILEQLGLKFVNCYA